MFRLLIALSWSLFVSCGGCNWVGRRVGIGRVESVLLVSVVDVDRVVAPVDSVSASSWLFRLRFAVRSIC